MLFNFNVGKDGHLQVLTKFLELPQDYAKTASIPVMSIVDFGVALFADAMLADPTSVSASHMKSRVPADRLASWCLQGSRQDFFVPSYRAAQVALIFGTDTTANVAAHRTVRSTTSTIPAH